MKTFSTNQAVKFSLFVMIFRLFTVSHLFASISEVLGLQLHRFHLRTDLA